mmetsp:Transcript_92987/g.259921  ORF Transcript_92987/g.259921 Transcript_92987/m.259921 type:complete len:512 (+) Transcript_92987:1224-2759(+)
MARGGVRGRHQVARRGPIASQDGVQRRDQHRGDSLTRRRVRLPGAPLAEDVLQNAQGLRGETARPRLLGIGRFIHGLDPAGDLVATAGLPLAEQQVLQRPGRRAPRPRALLRAANEARLEAVEARTGVEEEPSRNIGNLVGEWLLLQPLRHGGLHAREVLPKDALDGDEQHMRLLLQGGGQGEERSFRRRRAIGASGQAQGPPERAERAAQASLHLLTSRSTRARAVGWAEPRPKLLVQLLGVDLQPVHRCRRCLMRTAPRAGWRPRLRADPPECCRRAGGVGGGHRRSCLVVAEVAHLRADVDVAGDELPRLEEQQPAPGRLHALGAEAPHPEAEVELELPRLAAAERDAPGAANVEDPLRLPRLVDAVAEHRAIEFEVPALPARRELRRGALAEPTLMVRAVVAEARGVRGAYRAQRRGGPRARARLALSLELRRNGGGRQSARLRRGVGASSGCRPRRRAASSSRGGAALLALAGLLFSLLPLLAQCPGGGAPNRAADGRSPRGAALP